MMNYFDYASSSPPYGGLKNKLEQIILNYDEYLANQLSKKNNEQLLISLDNAIITYFDNSFPYNRLCYTYSGTMANNIAITYLHYHGSKGLTKRPACSNIEHPSVKNVVKNLGGTIVNVNSDGRLNLLELENLLCEGMVSVFSCMAVNNETGIILQTDEIAELCRKFNVFFHCDCVQAVHLPKLPIADSISMATHKICGVKGLAFFTLPKSLNNIDLSVLPSYLSDTVNRVNSIDYISSMLYLNYLDDEINRKDISKFHFSCQSNLWEIRKLIKNGLLSCFEDVVFHEGNYNSEIYQVNEFQSPHILSAYIPYYSQDAMLINMSMRGFSISAGSACSSGAINPSETILAMGFSEEYAKHCIRISFGSHTSIEDAGRLVEAFATLKKKSSR